MAFQLFKTLTTIFFLLYFNFSEYIHGNDIKLLNFSTWTEKRCIDFIFDDGFL